MDVRSLYKVTEKADAIQALVMSYVDQLKKTGHFSQSGKFICHLELPFQIKLNAVFFFFFLLQIVQLFFCYSSFYTLLCVIISDADAGQPKEPACALLWTYYFLAQHYDFLEDTEKAISYIDAAIDHTPTLIELFVCKGRIYKVGLLYSCTNTLLHKWEVAALDSFYLL